MTTPTVFDKKVTSLVNEAVVEVQKMFGSYVDADDLRQIMYMWMLEHEDKVPTLAQRSGWYLKRRLMDACIPYGRKEKAHKTGYWPEDEYFYSMRTLAELLPDAFDLDATRPQTGPLEGGRSGDKSFLEWETQITDIRVALNQISYTDYTVLQQFVERKREPNDSLVRSSLRALQLRLGGPR